MRKLLAGTLRASGVYARRIETGSVYGREVVIKRGLGGDEAVVFAGQGKLRDGSRVSLVKQTASEEAPYPLEETEVR